MTRCRGASWFIPMLLVVTLVASACHAGKNTAGNGSGGGVPAAIAAGVPDPGAGPDAALLPPAAAAPPGTPQAQAAALAKQVSAGGTGALAALRTAVHLSGIELIEVDGTKVDAAATPVSGLEIPVGQVLRVVDQNTYAHGLMASDIASAFDAIDQDKTDVTSLRTNLVSTILNQAQPDPHTSPTTAFLASFIVALGQDAGAASDLTAYQGSDVRLTGLQEWLTLLDMASTFWTDGVIATAKKKAGSADIATTLQSGLQTQSVLAGTGPCNPDDPNGTTGKIMDGAALVGGLLSGGIAGTWFSGYLGLIGDATDTNASGWSAGDWASLAGLVLSVIKIVIETFALSGTITLVGGDPLVRTKEEDNPDQQRHVKVTINYNIGRGQYANCLRVALNTAGLDFTLPNDGPLTNADLYWDMENSPGGIVYNPLEFYDLPDGGNKDAVDTTTDNSGSSQTGLESIRRDFVVPPNAPQQMKTVTLLIGVQLKKSNFYNNFSDAIGSLMSGPLAGAAQIAVGMLERMKALTVSGTVQVQDWQTDFRINSSGKYTSAGTTHVTFTKCDGIAGTWSVGPGESFTLDETGHGEFDYGPYELAVTFVDGDPPVLKMKGDDIRQEWTVMAGDFCHHKD